MNFDLAYVDKVMRKGYAIPYAKYYADHYPNRFKILKLDCEGKIPQLVRAKYVKKSNYETSLHLRYEDTNATVSFIESSTDNSILLRLNSSIPSFEEVFAVAKWTHFNKMFNALLIFYWEKETV